MFRKKHWTDRRKELLSKVREYADSGDYKKAIECVWEGIKIIPQDIDTSNYFITEAACGVMAMERKDTFGGFAYIAVKMAEMGIGTDDEMLELMLLAEKYARAADVTNYNPNMHLADYPMCQAWRRIAASLKKRNANDEWMGFMMERDNDWCGNT